MQNLESIYHGGKMYIGTFSSSFIFIYPLYCVKSLVDAIKFMWVSWGPYISSQVVQVMIQLKGSLFTAVCLNKAVSQLALQKAQGDNKEMKS